MQEACVGVKYERNQVDKLSIYNKAYNNILTYLLFMSRG